MTEPLIITAGFALCLTIAGVSGLPFYLSLVLLIAIRETLLRRN